MNPSGKVRIFAVALLVVAVGAFLVSASQKDAILQAVEGVNPWMLAVVYAVATVALVPLWILAMAAGFALGFEKGAVAVLVGNIAGSALAFMIGRKLVRGWVDAKIAADPRLGQIDQAARRRGFVIVFLTRLSPGFPSTILNYVFGGTAISLPRFLVASVLGMAPLVALYLAIGVAAKDGLKLEMWEKASLGVGIVVTVFTIWVIARIIRGATSTPPPRDPRP